MKLFKNWRYRRQLKREVQAMYEDAVADWLAAMHEWRESDMGRAEPVAILKFEGELSQADVERIKRNFRECYTKRGVS